ncbi:MAG: hypothetical protein IJ679_08845 [Lachnospiraceae bacterium]|nr:hypothetical protein [Lachnospiraceae bacterium]
MMDLELYEAYEGMNGTIQFRRCAGMEKTRKELSKLEDIEEIPYYDFLTRAKVGREYFRYMSGMRNIKADLVATSRKLQRVNQNLERTKHYPDVASNRHQLLDEKSRYISHINKWQRVLWDTSRVKVQNCAKALGKEVLPDIEFIFYVDVDAV